MFAFLQDRISRLRQAHPGYISALASGYAMTGANLLVQVILTPFYLKYLGSAGFGGLMVMLSVINFAAVGIGWMSGGMVRMMGECWSREELAGFRNVFVVGKYVFTLYAIAVALILGGLWFAWAAWEGGQEGGTAVTDAWLAGLYLVISYESLPERQGFVGTNQQAMGNWIEFVRVILFALLAFVLLPVFRNTTAVWIALIVSVLAQRIFAGRYWSLRGYGIGWSRFTPEMVPVLRRLGGRQGVGYVTYGALLLTLQADTIVIGILGGPGLAGEFVLLWKIPEALGLLLWKVPFVMEPRVIQLDATQQSAKVDELFRRGRVWFVGLVFLVALSYVVFGKWVAELWVGEHAPKENWMYIAAGVAMFFSTVARWPISFAYAQLMLAGLNRVATIEVLGKLVLTVVLFPFCGIAAPMLAVIIMHIAYVALAYQRLTRSVGVFV